MVRQADPTGTTRMRAWERWCLCVCVKDEKSRESRKGTSHVLFKKSASGTGAAWQKLGTSMYQIQTKQGGQTKERLNGTIARDRCWSAWC